MRFSSIVILTLPFLARAVSSWQVSIEVENEVLSRSTNKNAIPLSEENPTFQDERIKDHPDKKLLGRIREFFKTFTTGDFNGMRDLQSENYTMTNIHFDVVRKSRSEWYDINKGLTGLISNLRVVALNLYGSSEPGQHSILEHVTLMELNITPKGDGRYKFPPGAEKGDTVGIVNLCVLWWDEEGLISQEFEYGGLTWKDFSLDAWDNAGSSLFSKEL